jgi:hypothetical protein
MPAIQETFTTVNNSRRPDRQGEQQKYSDKYPERVVSELLAIDMGLIQYHSHTIGGKKRVFSTSDEKH